ncbi:MAG: hypothetical protein R2832_14765 [Rhodothermales bacterium]
MKTLARLVTLSLVALALTSSSKAQDQIQLFVTVDSPVPPYIERWDDLVAIELQVNPLAAQESYDVVLTGRASNTDPSSGISVVSTGFSDPITISKADGPVRLTIADIRRIFGPDNLDFQGFDPFDYRSADGSGQRVPGGCYEICVQAYEATTLLPLGQTCSIPFGVLTMTPPRLLQPMDGATLEANTDVALVPSFMWQVDPVVASRCALGPTPALEYEIEMIEVPEAVSPEDALNSGGGTIFRERLFDGSTIFDFVPDDYGYFPMTPGAQYAWRVRAQDAERQVYVENDGYSPVRTFRYGTEPAELMVSVTPGRLMFTPASPTQSIEIHVRGSGGSPTAGIAAYVTGGSVTFLDGMRIVHGPIDITELDERVPVNVLSPTYEVDANVTIPPGVADAILGSRSSANLEMHVTIFGEDAATSESISSTEIVDVGLSGSAAPFVVQVLTRAGEPMSADNTTVTPDQTNLQYRLVYRNNSATDITVRSATIRLQAEGGTTLTDSSLPISPFTLTPGGERVVDPADFNLASLSDELHALIDPESGVSSFRIDGHEVYTATDASGAPVTAPVDYSLTYEDNSSFPLVVRVLTSEGVPMTASNTTVTPDQLNLTYRLEYTNNSTRPITLQSLRAMLTGPDGSNVVDQTLTYPPSTVVPPNGGTRIIDPADLILSGLADRMHALIDPESGDLSYRLDGDDEYVGVDDLGNRITAYSRYSLTYDDLDANPLVVRVLTRTGQPMTSENTTVSPESLSLLYRLEYVNNSDRPITMQSARFRLNGESGTEVYNTTTTYPDAVVVPARGTRVVDPADFDLSSVADGLLALIDPESGNLDERLTGEDEYAGVDDLGNRITARSSYSLLYSVAPIPESFTVRATTDAGFPVRFSPSRLSVPLTYEFTSGVGSPVTITSYVQEYVTFSGDEIISRTATPPADWATVPASGTLSRELEFGWPSTTTLPIADSDRAEGVRCIVTFTGTDLSGAEHTASTTIPVQFLPSNLVVSVSTDGGLPVNFFPSQTSVPVSYHFTNLGTTNLEIVSIEQWIDYEDGDPYTPHTTAARPTPLRVDAGAEATDSDTRFAIREPEISDPSLSLMGRVRFTARVVDNPSETVTAFVEFPIRVRQSELLVTADAPGGFPLTIHPGVDRRDVTYRYTNEGAEPVTIVGIRQEVSDESGAELLAPTGSTLSTPVEVAAGATVEDSRYFGVVRSVVDRVLSERGDNVRANVRVLFTVRRGASESTAVVEYAALLTNSTLLVTIETEEPRPVTFYAAENSHPATFHFQNVGSTDLTVTSVRQHFHDDADEFVLGPFDAPRSTPLVVPAGGTVDDRGTVGTASSFMDDIRARGADRLLTGEYTFTATRGSETVAAETHLPMRVAIGDRPAGLHFLAASPEDGARVRGAATFEIQSSESVSLARISGIYLQIWRIPDGTEDPAAIMVDANRVVERTFANSSSTNLIRHVEADNKFKLLTTRGATPESDTQYTFEGARDSSYLWVARVDFARNADGDPETSSMSIEPARFTYRDATAECGAECSLTAPTGPGMTSRGAEYYVNRTVTIGAFEMRIISASGTGASLTGEGSVDVPYLRAPILVQFSGIGINSSNQVFSGEAKAKTDRPDLLTNDYTDRVTELSESMSITESDARTITEISEAIESTGRIISAFSSGHDPVQLPIGIDQHIDGEFLLLAVVGIKFKPTGARLNAVLSVPLPEMESRLAIGARGICLTPSGFDEEFTFYLASDLFITLNEFDASLPDYTMRFKAGGTDGSGTYMQWECGEMKALRLEMWHEFPRDWLKPVNPETGEIIADETKKSTAKLVVEIRPAASSSSDGGGSGGGSGGSGGGSGGSEAVTEASGLQWIAGVREFTPSAISDANGFWFSVESMFYDNSSVQNPDGMTFPAGYPSSLSNNRWTGFYLGVVRLHLPDEIRSFGEDNNIEVQVRNVLLDNTGVNFTFAVRNLLTLKEDDGSDATDCAAVTGDGASTSTCTGSMGGWEFSVDEISISVLHSSFGTANLNGQFRIPITDTPLAYSATLARPASLRTDDSSSGGGSGGGGGSSGGGSGGSSDAGSDAARQFRFECADLLAPRASGGSGGSGGDSGGSSGGSSTAPDLIFEMLVKPTGDISGDIWAADLTIERSSKICVGNQSGSIQAGAELNGRIGIKADSTKIPAVISGIPIERLRVMTFSPYFEAPDMARSSFTGFGGSGGSGGSDSGSGDSGDRDVASSGDSDSGFAVDISDIGLEIKAASPTESGRMGVEAGISFDIAIQLPGDGVFRASARGVTIWGRINLATEDEPAGFDFAGFGGTSGPGTLPLFCVGGEAEVLEIEGCIQVYKDRESRDTPGAKDSGVAGAIDAVIAQQIGIRVAADFGHRVQGSAEFDYFFVDAAAYITSGINIGGAVALYGIMGGVWYNMTGPAGFDRSATPEDYAQVRAQTDAEPSLEAALRKYRPVSAESEGTWGFKAGLILGVAGNADVFNVDVFVEAQINSSGDLDYLRLVGDAYVMTKLTDRSDPTVRGTLVVQLSFAPYTHPDGSSTREASFDANFTLTGNLAEVLTIDGAAGLHIGPDYWQFYIGRPERRFSASLGFGDVDILTLGTYLMVGERLPPFPDPPAGVPSLRGSEQEQSTMLAAEGSDGVDAEGNPTKNISGFMMGANFSMSPNLDLGIIGMDISFMLGFDVAVTQSERYCATGDLSNPRFRRGDNGWYTEGQIYATADLDFWTRALFGIKVSLARLHMGALLRAGFPNPEYIAGALEIEGDILGGVWEFDGRVDFEVGKACTPIPRSPLQSIDLITDIRPDRNASGYRPPSPLIAPATAYFLDVERPFTLEDETGALRQFRMMPNTFTIRNTDENRDVPCQKQTLQSGSVVGCFPIIPSTRMTTHLDGETNYSVYTDLRVEEFVRGAWVRAVDDTGEPITADTSATFRTGCLPDELDGQIRGTYPINGQRYFLRGESNFGYVDVGADMSYLLTGPPACSSSSSPLPSASSTAGYDIIVRFTPLPDGDIVDMPVTVAGQRWSFTIPSLEPETVYGAQIIRKERRSRDYLAEARQNTLLNRDLIAASIDQNVLREAFAVSGAVRVRQRTLSALVTNRSDEKRLYHWVFRTSRYQTLRSKINDTSFGPAEYVRQFALVFEVNKLKSSLTPREDFDDMDIVGRSYVSTEGVDASLGGGVTLPPSRAIRLNTVPLYYRDWTGASATYLRTVQRNVYEPEAVLRRYSSYTGYRGFRYGSYNQYWGSARDMWNAKAGLVRLSSSRSVPPLPDDPDQLAAQMAASYGGSSSSGGGSGGGGGFPRFGYSNTCMACTFGGPSVNPSIFRVQYTLHYDVGSAASADWVMLRLYGPRLVARRPHYYDSRARRYVYYNLSPLPERMYLPFARPTRGVYPVLFQYFSAGADEFHPERGTQAPFSRSIRY